MNDQEELIFRLRLEGLLNQFDSLWRTTTVVEHMDIDSIAEHIGAEPTDEEALYEIQYKELVQKRIENKRSL